MPSSIDIEKFKSKAKLKDRYEKQISRLHKQGVDTSSIETAVKGAVSKIGNTKAALVIYGEPQSGKTEMMICLTGKLLDDGHRIIVHLMNDSVDLLSQNLKRFKASGLAPSPKSFSELPQSFVPQPNQEIVVFCKKNAHDLEKLIERLKSTKQIVVVDDEADYATPNAKINKGTKTKINNLVGQLIGQDGHYIGVTATPARLDLNNTFQNDTDKWVKFPPHSKYTGQDTFFPVEKEALPYRLTLLPPGPDPNASRDALVRFLVTSANLNVNANSTEQNYTMLVHTSGKKQDHAADRAAIEQTIQQLSDPSSHGFGGLVGLIHAEAARLYPTANSDKITEYVVANVSRATLVVLNSERDRKAAGDSATEPSSPFTIVIGGNIVSRGVTFPNLLSMFFTRNVAHRLQQDTYIQRARMFGSRGQYLEHFELTIPDQLYSDWHRCFVFHRLALATLGTGLGSPVWIGDSRVAVAGSASIDKATVALDKGEMSFGLFDFDSSLDSVVLQDQTAVTTLQALRNKIGNDSLPEFLIKFIEKVAPSGADSLAIHTASSIASYGGTANQELISRDKGFMGKSQLEVNKFPNAVHHVKIFRNADGKAKLFYKYQGSLQFVQNIKQPTSASGSKT
jgi:hypothetical protein